MVRLALMDHIAASREFPASSIEIRHHRQIVMRELDKGRKLPRERAVLHGQNGGLLFHGSVFRVAAPHKPDCSAMLNERPDGTLIYVSQEGDLSATMPDDERKPIESRVP